MTKSMVQCDNTSNTITYEICTIRTVRYRNTGTVLIYDSDEKIFGEFVSKITLSTVVQLYRFRIGTVLVPACTVPLRYRYGTVKLLTYFV